MQHTSLAPLPMTPHTTFLIGMIKQWQAGITEHLHFLSTVFCLVSVLALSSLLAPNRALAAPLSLGSASLDAEYHVTLYTGGSITCGIDNCLRVDIYDRFGANGGVFIMEANGGWASLPTDSYGIVNLTPDTDQLRFTVSVNYGTFFENNLTSAQHRVARAFQQMSVLSCALLGHS